MPGRGTGRPCGGCCMVGAVGRSSRGRAGVHCGVGGKSGKGAGWREALGYYVRGSVRLRTAPVFWLATLAECFKHGRRQCPATSSTSI